MTNLEEPFEGYRKALNELPESLFVNVGWEEGLFGWGTDAAYVCPDHNGRHLPCRTCLYTEPATSPYVSLHDYRVQVVFDALDEAGYQFSERLDLDFIVDYLARKGF